MPVGVQVSRHPSMRAAGFDQVYLLSTHEERVLGEDAWTGPSTEQEADAWLRRLVQLRAPAWSWLVEASVMLDDGLLLDFRFMVKPRHTEPLRVAAIRHFHGIKTDDQRHPDHRGAAGTAAERLSGHSYQAAPSWKDWWDHVMRLHHPRTRRG